MTDADVTAVEDADAAGDGRDGTDVDDPDEASVRRTYDYIAEHFSRTREYPWPEVESFLDGRDAHHAVDVGCGNGRHAEAMADRADLVVGCDLSRALLVEARDRAENRGYAADLALAQADAAALPFADRAFDLGVYVATLHHLPTRRARRTSLDELARVLTADGVALVSAWSTAHETFDREEGFDTTIDWTLPGGETVPRFYHVYAPGEFRDDVAASDLRLVDFELSSGNCYGVVEPG